MKPYVAAYTEKQKYCVLTTERYGLLKQTHS